MKLLSLAPPYPPVALEITAGWARAAAVDEREGKMRLSCVAERPLPAGAVEPGLTEPNVRDAAAVERAVRELCQEVGHRGRNISLVLPDAACRAHILDFEALPPSRREMEEIVWLRLRKVLPFGPEAGRVSIATLAPGPHGPRLLTLAAREDVLGGYEAAVGGAGLTAGLLDTAILCIVGLVDRARLASGGLGAVMVVAVEGSCFSVAIVRDGDLLFLRTKSLGDGAAVAEAIAREVRLCHLYFQDRIAGGALQAVVLWQAGPEDPRLGAEIQAAVGIAVERLDPASVLPSADPISRPVPAAAPVIGLLACRLGGGAS